MVTGKDSNSMTVSMFGGGGCSSSRPIPSLSLSSFLASVATVKTDVFENLAIINANNYVKF